MVYYLNSKNTFYEHTRTTTNARRRIPPSNFGYSEKNDQPNEDERQAELAHLQALSEAADTKQLAETRRILGLKRPPAFQEADAIYADAHTTASDAKIAKALNSEQATAMNLSGAETRDLARDIRDRTEPSLEDIARATEARRQTAKRTDDASFA